MVGWVWIGLHASAQPPEADDARAEVAWEGGPQLRFASDDRRVAGVAFDVTLAHGDKRIRWSQPTEVVGIAPLVVPVVLPTEPPDPGWPREQRVRVRLSGALLDVEGALVGSVVAPPRDLIWTDAGVRLAPVPETRERAEGR